MLKKKCVIYIISNLTFCPKRFESSIALVQNTSDKTDYTPSEYIPVPSKQRKKRLSSDCLYVSDPSVAKNIVEKIIPYLKTNSKTVIAECNPGLGLITKQLLKYKVGTIKLFEPSSSFRDSLKEITAKYSMNVEIYSKSIFKLYGSSSSACHHVSKMDDILKNVPKKAWTDDPAISLIGPMVNYNFLYYMMESLTNLTSFFSYGRVEMFLIMNPSKYLALSLEPDIYRARYNFIIVFFNLFFDYQLLDKLPRTGFLTPKHAIPKKQKLHKLDDDKLYLVRAVSKIDLPLKFEELAEFNFFLRKCFKKNAGVIPTLERCVPGCGAHLLIPQHEHEDYFRNLNIYTLFGELTPIQVLGVFQEMYKHPQYRESPICEAANAKTTEGKDFKPISRMGWKNNSIINTQAVKIKVEEELEMDENCSEED